MTRPIALLAGALAWLSTTACGSPGVECGPGTHEEAGLCVPDALDGAAPVDAGIDATIAIDASVIRPGDTLRASPASIEVVRGTMTCLALTVLHADGTTDPIAPGSPGASLEVGDESVIVPTDDGDCPGLGVIGEAMGATTVRVEVIGGAEAISATLPVQVHDLTIVPNVLLVPTTMGVGTEHLYGLTGLGARARDASMASVPWPGGTYVPRWLRLESSAPAIAATEAIRADTWRVRALSPGTATIRVVYDAPALAGPVSAPAGDVQVVTAGVLAGIAGVELRGLDGAPHPSAVLAPGTCVTAHLRGLYTAGSSSYYAEIVEGVTWRVDGASLRGTEGSTFEVCADTQGDGAIVGCHEGRCVPHGVVVAGETELVSISATTPAGAIEPESRLRFCIPLSVVAHLADGSERDVTASAALRLDASVESGFGPPGSRETWASVFDAAGRTVTDSDGDRCLALTSGGGRSLSAGDLQIAYGTLSTSIPFEVAFPE